MIDIKNLTYRIGARLLFEDTSVRIPADGKIGIVGQNGCGKTTLFRLIFRQEEADAGKILVKNGAKLAYVKQEIEDKNITLLDFIISADSELMSLRKILDDANSTDEELNDAYDRMNGIDGYSASARASAILSGLGFKQSDFNKKLSEFSGGWQVRASLAATLFAPSDCLFLDEPTNHLDLETSIWLENHLEKSGKTIVMISHEKQFLNKICNYIISIYDKKLHLFAGNYDTYKMTRQSQETALIRNIETQTKKREHMQSFIDRFGAKATKAKQAQSRLKMIEKMEIPEMPSSVYKVEFSFPNPSQKVDKKLVILEHASAGYDDKIVLNDINLCINIDDRVALLGANGNGKTTLAKLLSGRLQAITGDVSYARNVKISYFSQQQADELDISKTPVDIILSSNFEFLETQARSFLARFGITDAKSMTIISKLSGGEKSRVLLAMNSLCIPHLMIFDEPTNHLDIEAREALIDAINKFAGAVVLITHDFYTLSKTCNRFVLVDGGTCRQFSGTLEDYKNFLLNSSSTQNVNDSKKINVQKVEKQSTASKKIKKELSIIEKKIQELEIEKSSLEQKLSNYYSDEVYSSYEKCCSELSKLETEWLNLSEST